MIVSDIDGCDESEENNMNSKTKIHHYKGFDIIKDGKKNLEWNIYKPFKDVSIITGNEVILRHWVGCGRRIIDCKTDIDNGCFEV